VTPPADPPPAGTRSTRRGRSGHRKGVQPAGKPTDEKENELDTPVVSLKRARGWVWVTESELAESQPPAKVPRTRLRDRNPNLTYKV
jgi:hypothetical protein